jgi:hypothetical protein
MTKRAARDAESGSGDYRSPVGEDGLSLLLHRYRRTTTWTEHAHHGVILVVLE